MLKQAASIARLGRSTRHRPPSFLRVVAATAAAIVGSLLADAVVVFVAQAIFPSVKGYVHFQFRDYARLTVIGVVIAGAAWPVVTLVTSVPRWLYLRLAILVTIVLWLPDVYILYRGQPSKGVAALMVMHVAIALVTYNLLVRAAPVRPVG